MRGDLSLESCPWGLYRQGASEFLYPIDPVWTVRVWAQGLPLDWTCFTLERQREHAHFSLQSMIQCGSWTWQHPHVFFRTRAWHGVERARSAFWWSFQMRWFHVCQEKVRLTPSLWYILYYISKCDPLEGFPVWVSWVNSRLEKAENGACPSRDHFSWPSA